MGACECEWPIKASSWRCFAHKALLVPRREFLGEAHRFMTAPFAWGQKHSNRGDDHKLTANEGILKRKSEHYRAKEPVIKPRRKCEVLWEAKAEAFNFWFSLHRMIRLYGSIPHAVQCKVLATEPPAFLRLLMSVALSEKEVGVNTLKNKTKRSFARFWKLHAQVWEEQSSEQGFMKIWFLS